MMLDEHKGELAGTTVLVVDDQADVRETLEAFFAMFGMNVTTAASGNEAYDLFRQRRPQVVVSDIWMPDGNGIDLIKQIRALAPEEGGLTPAISVSGGAKADESLEAGFHFHFVKPVDPLRLLDAVRDFVRTDGAARAQWSVALRERDLMVRIDGHLTGADARATVAQVIKVLAGRDPTHVIVDLRGLTGLDPSAGAATQAGMWEVRHHISSVVVVGGTWLAKAIARSSCLILGLECRLSDTLP
jgi:CheY-like chemotaxis protein